MDVPMEQVPIDGDQATSLRTIVVGTEDGDQFRVGLDAAGKQAQRAPVDADIRVDEDEPGALGGTRTLIPSPSGAAWRRLQSDHFVSERGSDGRGCIGTGVVDNDEFPRFAR
jgi:hypothetical protein